jgi:hypothetical protein
MFVKLYWSSWLNMSLKWMCFCNAGITLSRNWHQMDTRWRKCSNSALIGKPSGHSWEHLKPSYDRRWSFSGSGSSFVSGGWVHDGIARASRSRVAFLRQSGSFLFPSYCLREVKNARWHRWSHEVKTKMTRFDKMPSRWPYDVKPSQCRRVPIVL